ncbi:hypothetical protein MBRA_06357 [Methylobacterium brachiatum]|nr:hypothetical protein MBRA_06357 [Methylobacterium brachiatum]
MTLRRILEAPIANLTFADIEALIHDEAEEGARLELKRGLPANDRQVDPWMTGGPRIGNPARDGLAKELVALANAYGGAVVVGIDETDDYPKRARGPNPITIPRVVELAERMQQALDSLIDPPLAVLEVRGIERPDSDGEGVLVIRTGASTRAPHGHGRPPQAYMRRGSRSEPMSMRDLQSVLFETRTRGERISALLEERRGHLTRMVARGLANTTADDGLLQFRDERPLYFRCTLVTAEDLRIRAEHLRKDSQLIRPYPGTSAFGEGSFQAWHPRLNGIESLDRGNRHFARWFIGDHGIADAYGFMVLEQWQRRSDVFPVALFPPVALQVIALGEVMRRAAGRPEVEMVVECEFIISGSATAYAGDGRPFDNGVYVPEGEMRIGPFSLGNFEDWRSVFAEMERGIWNSLGMQPPTVRLNFDLDQWLADVKAT